MPLRAALACCVAAAAGDVYYSEEFPPHAQDAWVAAPGSGRVRRAHGRYFGDSGVYIGLQTAEDARFYALSAPLDRPFHTDGRDIVVSFTVQHSQGVDCAGGYVKLLPKTPPQTFSGDSGYYLMFGPDICGEDKVVQMVFGHRGRKLHWKKRVAAPDDRMTHAYTAVVRADDTYQVLVDGEAKASGRLEEDWDFLPPKTMDDPADVKPAGWVDAAEVPDAADVRPEDWDEAQQETIPDPDAKRPVVWDDEEIEDWEPPYIPNPRYKGRWKPRMIPNPAYRGPYVPRQIPNPLYRTETGLANPGYALEAIGIDVWQVSSGTVFDNFMVSDSLVEAEVFAWQTLYAFRHDEQEMLARERAAAKEAAKTWRDTQHEDHYHYDDGYEYAD
eukprot:TRINITY_DN3108_c0_g1_i1.p1 TRINITY_DN3108_c0_g1~~TRINITY_DN3108_c0_g1_i1.p1  ORF type:complete len:400 (+),score=132.78 TRINITY_DN3108_c0_g1_i1:43-1200(+)